MSVGKIFVVAEPVKFNPGIPGFIKASRHLASGAALVMTQTREDDADWLSVFWVKRLAHNAWPYCAQLYRYMNEKTRAAAERTFDFLLASGPPPHAICDNQRQRVYDWEDECVLPYGGQPMPWSGCLLFGKYVWNRVGKGKPLVFTNDGTSKTAYSSGGTIFIPDDPIYQNKAIILHEISHELSELGQHGPEFVSTYMGLCVRFLGMSHRELQESASQWGVDFIK